MPIHCQQFENQLSGRVEMNLSPDTTQGQIYTYLKEHCDKAFRVKELKEEIEVPNGSVSPALNRLNDHGLVIHRGIYWAITDKEADKDIDLSDYKDNNFKPDQMVDRETMDYQTGLSRDIGRDR